MVGLDCSQHLNYPWWEWYQRRAALQAALADSGDLIHPLDIQNSWGTLTFLNLDVAKMSGILKIHFLLHCFKCFLSFSFILLLLFFLLFNLKNYGAQYSS